MVWLMYSSGTTGVSKGQVHTHRSVVSHLHHLRFDLQNLKEKIHGNFMATFDFLLSMNTNPKRTKYLFENFLVNAGGMIMLLISTLTHFDIYCLAEMSFDNFLVAIDRVKVNSQNALTFLKNQSYSSKES